MLEHWVANWVSQIGWYPFFSLGGPIIQGHKVQHLLVSLGQIGNIFSLFQP
jgi:hypothetical protein